jgi:hypothetical protein
LALKDLEQANWEVEQASSGECRRFGQEIESLKEKLVAQQQERNKLQKHSQGTAFFIKGGATKIACFGW